VIWTDVVQTFIYISGTLVGLVTILHLVPGGWNSVQTLATAAHKFQVFDLTLRPGWPYLDFTQPYTLWAGVIGGTFLTLATHGTDQLIVQRLLTAGTSASRPGVGVERGGDFDSVRVVPARGRDAVCLLSASGFGLRQVGPHLSPVHCHAHATRNFRPLIAAILAAAMSNLSAALNSLSSSTMFDFYFRFRPVTDEKKRLQLSRLANVMWALVLFGWRSWHCIR